MGKVEIDLLKFNAKHLILNSNKNPKMFKSYIQRLINREYRLVPLEVIKTRDCFILKPKQLLQTDFYFAEISLAIYLASLRNYADWVINRNPGISKHLVPDIYKPFINQNRLLIQQEDVIYLTWEKENGCNNW